MDYKVNYSHLEGLNKSITAQTCKWASELNSIKSTINAIVGDNMTSGESADSVKEYFRYVHGYIIQCIQELINTNNTYFLAYKIAYHSNVDDNNKTNISTDELDEIRNRIAEQKRLNSALIDEINKTIKGVRSICSVSTPASGRLVNAYAQVNSFIDDIKKQIEEIERKHAKSDFVTTGNHLASINSFINSQLSHNRDFMQTFSAQTYLCGPEFSSLYSATEEMHAELDERSQQISEAYAFERERLRLLEEERAEREKKAKLMKIGVMIASVAAAIIVSAVVPGGAVLVLAAASAIRGAATSAANSAIDAWVDDGEISKDEWEEVGKDAFKGAVVSGASSIVGSAVTSITDNTIIGTTLLSSKNEIVRVGTGVVVGSTKSIASGVISRGIGEAVDEIIHGEELSWAKIKEKAFDSRKMWNEGIIGGASGGLSEGKRFDKEMRNETLSRKEIIENEGMTPREFSNMESKLAKERVDYGLDPEKSWYDKVDDYVDKNLGKDVITIIDTERKVYETITEDFADSKSENQDGAGGEDYPTGGENSGGSSGGGFREE